MKKSGAGPNQGPAPGTSEGFRPFNYRRKGESNMTAKSAAVATAPRRGGFLRSFVHRMTDEPVPLPDEGRLPSLEGATRWLNSPPLVPDDLTGQVVLVNFWTYTCINWIRTLPYLQAWDSKYRDHGLTIIGVHTPEFGFEHDLDNVIAAIGKLEVPYPIAVDNAYEIWRSFDNHFWPATYIADGQGRIRFHHFGEGEYPMTEMVIQRLLRYCRPWVGRFGPLVPPALPGVHAAIEFLGCESIRLLLLWLQRGE
jgi:thiol-disulfide isomerase/thioredoxin